MPIDQVVRRDLEGELLEVTDAAGKHSAKRLSLEVAWHLDTPEDLQDWYGDVVARVEQDWPQRQLIIHYDARVRPLTRPQLEPIVRPHAPLAAWRLTRLAADLCQWLEQLHATDLPQLVLHPGRVGIVDGRFVVLPTLAGILEPLSRLLDGPVWLWLPFIAPEVLRTRGSSPSLLPKADVYSLGRTLEALADPEWPGPAMEDPFAAAERLVESRSPWPPPRWPDGSTRLAEVVQHMCAALPEDRPDASELVRTFHGIIGQLDPVQQIGSLIDSRKLADASAHVDVLEESQELGAFALPRATLHMLRADIAMAHVPPQFARAIDQLKKAESYEPRSAVISQRIGRVYRGFEDHPQHVLLADGAYGRGARLSGWRADIVEEWLDVLLETTPEKLLERTSDIPWEKRPGPVFARRAASLLETGNPHGAWHECVDYFSQFGFNQTVYEIGQAAAARLPAAELLVWMMDRQNIDRLPAVQAIVWARNGQPEKAAAYLARALRALSEEA